MSEASFIPSLYRRAAHAGGKRNNHRAARHSTRPRRADPGKLPVRAQRDVTLRSEIQRVYEENFRVYGVRKVWRQLLREGSAVAAPWRA